MVTSARDSEERDLRAEGTPARLTGGASAL